MFALALWDPRSATLPLARDRIGKKPLYYTNQSGILYFASSFAAIATILRPLTTSIFRSSTRFSRWATYQHRHDSSGCQEAPGGNVRYRRYGWPAPFQFLGPSAEIVPYEGTWDQAVERSTSWLQRQWRFA
jgi:asparagine synthetase B (glutamine-hydrolysing)